MGILFYFEGNIFDISFNTVNYGYYYCKECPAGDQTYAYFYNSSMKQYANTGIEAFYAFSELLNEFWDFIGERRRDCLRTMAGVVNFLQGILEIGCGSVMIYGGTRN